MNDKRVVVFFVHLLTITDLFRLVYVRTITKTPKILVHEILLVRSY